SRPIIPMATAAQKDSRERMVAPLFGIILAPQAGTGFSPTFRVQRVVRGSIADEVGISENDPLSIRGFHVFENDGFALLDINIRKRRMGYMPATMRLPALLDTPDTL
ncbi:MAG: trypsin, partial [Treponema sp.]|nr:trypsin [Treponema sp.]